MKQISKAVLKGLLIIVLFTGGSIAISTTGVKTVNEASAATYNQVYEYLVAHGYTVNSLAPKQGTAYDWVANTIKNGNVYTTTIYCTETSITGVGDVAMIR
jgi:hypothetical protein